ncbi:MAG: PaaI family thioesterase [Bryobacterales bacterium]|nr:PaaI family thioesterase [Bryobacterales bacterium]
MTFTEFLKLRVTELRLDGVTIECPLEPFYFNPDQTLHGGLIATVADEAVWCALEHVLQQSRHSTTVELKVNYLRPAMNTAVLRARTTLVKTGRTLVVGTVELSDERGTLCAIATVTYMLLGER